MRRSWSRADWLALVWPLLASAALRLSGDPASTGAWALLAALVADTALRDCNGAGSMVATARSVALLAATASNHGLTPGRDRWRRQAPNQLRVSPQLCD